ncbi:hypothetical protein F5Y19DRAFT_56728 [Xylariaceae sp. FL1651]|nr:hypothetical protein F5Y19DRAFT_56728 [Xylariaceae sp. FL1651]
MRINENIAISTPKVLLVPYDAHLVGRYHEWMQNDELREATASDLLTLDEEYENQQSWRVASDKLTFILCKPVQPDADEAASERYDMPTVYAGEVDMPSRMIGDVNLFLTPCDDEMENIAVEEETDEADEKNTCCYCKGEIDIMIAAPETRRKGIGKAAVRALLQFLAKNYDAIMSEYSAGLLPSPHPSSPDAVPTPASDGHGEGGGGAGTKANAPKARLAKLVAKVHAENVGSIRLFEQLNFRQDGGPNYFNEVQLVLPWDVPTPEWAPALAFQESNSYGYREAAYDRSRLTK